MDRIHKELSEAKSVAISGHIRPDGDCMGSCLGLYNYIQKRYPEVDVDVYLESIPPAFKFMKNSDKIHLDCESDKVYDLFFSLDCGAKDRLGKAAKYLDSAKKSICIDHHVSNDGFADINYIEPDISSTSQYIYELIDTSYVDIPIAECLYVGIVHDTGVFQYDCTSSRTMAVAGELMDKGIDYSRLIDESYYMKYIIQNRVMGYCLLNCELKLDGKVVVAVLPLEVSKKYGAVPSDFEGIVAQLRHTYGIEVAIFAYEFPAGGYKVSLRSCNYVDVSKIAMKYDGGGHVKAAGCSVKGDIETILEDILAQVSEQL